jgi:Ca2+/Na+ antiporter
MDRARVEAILDAAEKAVSAGSPVGPTGFWNAVAAVKRDPGLVESHADRIARIDRASLKAWALVTVPLWLGNVLMIGGTAIGLAVVAWAYYLEDLVSGLVFLLGFGIVLVTTHGLGHLVVGSLLGMRFTHWFIGQLRPPLPPGVKIDYSTYLRAPARYRAWMHASGAIVTKLMPFAFVGAALAAEVPTWVVWALVGIGLAQIATDILWSTKASDWKKFRREMDLAQRSS